MSSLEKMDLPSASLLEESISDERVIVDNNVGENINQDFHQIESMPLVSMHFSFFFY